MGFLHKEETKMSTVRGAPFAISFIDKRNEQSLWLGTVKDFFTALSLSATSRVQEIRNRTDAIQQKNAKKTQGTANAGQSSAGAVKSTAKASNTDTVSISTRSNSSSYAGQYKDMSDESLDKTINNLKNTIKNSKSGTATYYAQKALEGYQAEKERRKTLNTQNCLSDESSAYYCQTGGWFENTDGSTACMTTAYSTLVSLTIGKQVKPNQVETIGNDGYLDNPIRLWKDKNGYEYTALMETSNDIWDEISDSIKSGEQGIVIHLGTHWVTVTGVKDGVNVDNIKSLDDLVGVDPWYNGKNDSNNKSGSGFGSGNDAFSGEIDLGTIKNKYGSPSGRFIRLVSAN